MNAQFEDKWKGIAAGKSPDEFSLYVPKGAKPRTQRQINLFWYYRFIKNIVGEKNYRTGLELGCGRGTMSLYLNQYEGFEVSMIDISPDSIATAKRIFDAVGASGTFVVGAAESLPFSDESFDVVYSIGLLEHLPDHKTAMKESHRVLRPGGVMISLNIPAKRSVQILNDWYKKVLGRFTGKKYVRSDYYRNSDTPAAYARTAVEAGFQNVYTVNVNPFPIFVPIPIALDRLIARAYNALVFIRSLFMRYPFKTSYWLSQGHFLVGYKKS